MEHGGGASARSDRVNDAIVAVRRFPARAWHVITKAVDAMITNAATRNAAQVAFFVLLSFPATLLLAVWGASTALDDPGIRKDVVDAVINALPLSDDEGRSEIESMLDRVADGAGGLGWIGAIALLWSASGALAALRYAVNDAWGERDRRPWAQGKLLDIAMVALAFPLVIAATAGRLANTITSALDDRPLLAGSVSFLVTVVLPIALVLGVLLILLRILPTARASWRAALGGAIVGTIALIVVQLGATAYFSWFGRSGAIYGTIGALLAACFTVYIGAIAVIVGVYVAATLARLPTAADIDAEMAEPGDGRPFGRQVLDAVRGLFLRPRSEPEQDADASATERDRALS